MAAIPAPTQAMPTRIWKRTTARKTGSTEGTGTPNTMVASPGMDFASGDLRSWAHCRGEQTCYRENAFEAFRDCCSVDLIEHVPALCATLVRRGIIRTYVHICI